MRGRSTLENEMEYTYHQNTFCGALSVNGRSMDCSVQSVDAPKELKQDAQLSQRDRAAGCVIVFAKSGRPELGDNILRTL